MALVIGEVGEEEDAVNMYICRLYIHVPVCRLRDSRSHDSIRMANRLLRPIIVWAQPHRYKWFALLHADRSKLGMEICRGLLPLMVNRITCWWLDCANSK